MVNLVIFLIDDLLLILIYILEIGNFLFFSTFS